MSLFYMFFTIRIILPILRNCFCILFHLILCFKVDLSIFYVIFFQLSHLFLVTTSSQKQIFHTASYAFFCIFFHLFCTFFPFFYKCTIFFFRFFVIIKSPAHKKRNPACIMNRFFRNCSFLFGNRKDLSLLSTKSSPSRRKGCSCFQHSVFETPYWQ